MKATKLPFEFSAVLNELEPTDVPVQEIFPSSHFPFLIEVQSSCISPSCSQFPETERGKQNTHLRYSFSENVKAVQNLVFYTIRALACWTETPPLNHLLSQHCGSQNPVSSRKSRSPVKNKDEQWKFRILTAAIVIFKVLKVIYKPLRQVETTLSPFFFNESWRGAMNTH